MGTWTSPAQVPPVPSIRSDKEPDMSTVKMMYDYLKKMANVISALRNDLEYMLNGHLDANNIRAESIETKNLKAGAVTADKISVNELSAISANLGTITAGLIRGIQIFGSYIATAEGTYPRTELSVTGNLLAVLQSADVYAQIAPSFLGSSPRFKITDGTVDGSIFTGYLNNALNIVSTKDIVFTTGSFNTVVFQNWTKIYNSDDQETLQDALDNLQSQINSLESRVTALGG